MRSYSLSPYTSTSEYCTLFGPSAKSRPTASSIKHEIECVLPEPERLNASTHALFPENRKRNSRRWTDDAYDEDGRGTNKGV